MKVLVCERGASLEKVLNLLTKNPARVLGLTGVKGTVERKARMLILWCTMIPWISSMLWPEAGRLCGIKRLLWKGTFEE